MANYPILKIYKLPESKFGIDTIRAKVLKRWPAYLLILAAIQPLFFPFTGLSKMLVRIAGLALLGFAWNLWVLAKEYVEHSEVKKNE